MPEGKGDTILGGELKGIMTICNPAQMNLLNNAFSAEGTTEEGLLGNVLLGKFEALLKIKVFPNLNRILQSPFKGLFKHLNLNLIPWEQLVPPPLIRLPGMGQGGGRSK